MSTTTIVELKGTKWEQIAQLEQVKAELYRDYLASDFNVELFEELESEYPDLNVASLSFATDSEYDDEGGYYDCIGHIEFYDANGKEIEINDFNPDYDHYEVSDLVKDRLEDVGVEQLTSYGPDEFINPKCKDQLKEGN